MMELVLEYGLIGMAVVAFLAATLLPFSSEAALAAGLLTGLDPYGLLVAASTGNCLACLLNYGLGYFFRRKLLLRTLETASGRTAVDWANRYGLWSLTASWLPIIGDPITVAAGFFRFNLAIFIPIVFGLRIARYLVIVGII